MTATEGKQVSLEDAVELAISHMKSENYRVAELVLTDILAAHPGHYDSSYMLGLAHYYMNNLPGAIEHIGNALKAEEAPAEWYSNYGIMLTEQKCYDEAIAAYEKAEAKEPDYAATYWNKSHSLWLAGRYEEAEVAARKGIEIAPESPEAWLNLGTAIVQQGRKEEAVECWEKALEANPDFAFAWNNLGNVLRDLGQLELSAEKCRKALELSPEYPQALNNLANVLLDQGDLEEAEDHYRRAVAGKPDYIEAHNNLAISLIKQSRFEEAAQAARVAISYDQNYGAAHLSLGTACKALGQLDEAEKAIQQAVLLQPDSAEVRIDLADLLYMRDRYADAEVELEKARQLEPDTPRLHLKLSDVLERGGKIEEALEALDKAVELNPEMPEAYVKRGNICHIANRAEEAAECYKKALELNPNFVTVFIALAELHLSMGDVDSAKNQIEKIKELSPDLPAYFVLLSKVKKFTDALDDDFQKMLALEKDSEKLGIEQDSNLNFALYKAYENIGDYDKAFEHLLKGNTLKRQFVPYEPEGQKESFKNIPKRYASDILKEFEGKGFDSDIPVFILGMPRSGTTLTEQIISSHGEVYGAGELLEISLLDNHFGALTPETAKKQGEWYIEQVQKRDKSGKAKRITDKMPGNFSSLGKIVSTLPNAKIIHTRRNPIDTCLSCFKQNFARGQYWSYDLVELGEYYNQYLELMAYWRDVLGDRFIEIDYETTVDELEPQARMLIDYVGLPWDEACLEPHKQKRTVLTASKMQVTKPVYKTSVKGWKRYEKQLEPLIEALGKGPAKDLLDL